MVLTPNMGTPLDSGRTIAELGEQGLLKLLQSYCPADVIGDDAALLTPATGYQLVVTTDVLVDGVHFSDRTTPPHSVGWRAAAANLSDLAAMGASGLGITVGLSLPPSCSVEWVQQLYWGMMDCLAPHDLAIVGGDVCRSEHRAIAITALGQVKPSQAWQRSTAQVGDAIVVTGSHGGSRAGLALLLEQVDAWGEALDALPLLARDELVRQHQYPQPRLDWVRDVKRLRLMNLGGLVGSLGRHRASAIDSSDGLADALLQLCRASHVGAKVEAAKIPIPESLKPWPELALDWALYGGEDFELVLCMAPGLAAKVCAESSLGTVMIGEITSELGISLIRENGLVQSLSLEQGFQHFSETSD